MKGIWRGKDDPFGLRYGKDYEILGDDFSGKMFEVRCELDEEYLFPAEDFEIIEV